MSRVDETLVGLAACLCAQVDADRQERVDANLPVSPQLCFCDLIPGEAPDGSYAGMCDDQAGMAWVRMISMYPAAAVGTVDQRPGNCTSGIGMDIELGILRPIPVASDDQGTPPEPEDVIFSAEQASRDALTLWKAVACCSALPNKDFRMSTFSPTGPLGGLVGGTYTVQVAL